MANNKFPPQQPYKSIWADAKISGGTIGPTGSSSITSNTLMWDGTNTGTITAAAQPFTEHHIKGDMLHVQKSVGFSHRMNSPVDDDNYKLIMKRELVQMLVDELWKTNHIEFTMVPDHSTQNNIYRARICTVPDTQVRILRERGLPK